MFIDLPPISFVDGVCIGCVLGKHPQDTFDKGKSWRALEALQLVHSDIEGPFPTLSFQGARYLLTFIDDYSIRTCVYFLKNKSEAFDNFLMFKALVEKQTRKPIKCLRTDYGREYVNLAHSTISLIQGFFPMSSSIK
jgi:hypothetical protein